MKLLKASIKQRCLIGTVYMEEGGGVKFHICVDRIVEGKGGFVLCLKHSLNFKVRNNLFFICRHKHEILTPFSLAYAQLLHQSW